MKKLLVLREKKQLQIFSHYLVIKDENSEQIIGYEQIKEIYLSDEFELPVRELIKLASYLPLYFIDHNGYIVGSISLEKR